MKIDLHKTSNASMSMGILSSFENRSIAILSQQNHQIGVVQSRNRNTEVRELISSYIWQSVNEKKHYIPEQRFFSLP